MPGVPSQESCLVTYSVRGYLLLFFPTAEFGRRGDSDDKDDSEYNGVIVTMVVIEMVVVKKLKPSFEPNSSITLSMFTLFE